MNQSKSKKWLSERNRILSVSGSLFWEKGYLGTSVNEIAKAARVNKATIYYYFKNKAQILYDISIRSAEGLKELLEPVFDSDLPPEKKLQELTTITARWAISNIGVSAIGQVEKRNLPPKLSRDYAKRRDDIERLFRQVTSEIIAQGKPESADCKLTTFFILGLVNSIVNWYKTGGEISAEQVISEVLAFISRAMNIPPYKGN